MSRFVKAEMSGSTTILVEVDENSTTNNNQKVGALDKIPSFDTILNQTVDNAKVVIDKCKVLALDEIELEFGIKLGVEAGFSFWGIAKASSDANISIKLHWKKDD